MVLFFYAIGHILKRDFSLELSEKEYQLREGQADQFASDFLINPDDYRNFLSNSNFSIPAVKDFAGNEGVHPGIVAGRLQNDFGYKEEFLTLNKLKVQYNFSK